MADFLPRPVIILDRHVSSTDRLTAAPSGFGAGMPGEFAATFAVAQWLTEGLKRMPATFHSAAKSDMPFGQ
jgi:hypothetical protein